MAAIEYFYSAHSSYAWLGSARFMAIATAAGRHIVHKPIDLDRVLEGAGSTAFRDRSHNYGSYFFNRELERWAEYRGVTTMSGRPDFHHHSPDLANCMLIAAMQQHNIDQLAHRMLVAHWAENADLADQETLVRLAEEQGFDGAGLLATARSATIRDQYDANTSEAIERSVFGSPTYFVDGDMFYGQDHLELVEQALQQPFANTWPAV